MEIYAIIFPVCPELFWSKGSQPPPDSIAAGDDRLPYVVDRQWSGEPWGGGAVGWMPTSCCSGLWLLAGKSWVWFWILVCVCVHVCMYMPVGTKADIGCLPQWLSLWFFCFFCFLKQGLSMMVKATKSTRLVDQTAPWTLLSPPLQCRDYRSALSDLWAGCWGTWLRSSRLQIYNSLCLKDLQ